MNEIEYSSTRLSYLLINWARDTETRKNLATEIKKAYEHIEKEHVGLNLKEDFSKFNHHFFAALYVNELAKDLINAKFPVIDLYKQYPEHLNWTKDSDLSTYVKEKDETFFNTSMQQKEVSLVPASYLSLSDGDIVGNDVKKDTNIYLQALVFNEIASNIQTTKSKSDNQALTNIKKIRQDSSITTNTQNKLR